jgi:hypothetical protein
MALLGQAAVAMWWSIRPERRAEFADWHSHEHFPERMSIPGFQRGSRWTSMREADGFFVLYELAHHETLTSTGYLDRLNAPTPWSTKMMPHHLNMVRSQCRIAASFGGGIAAALATIRLSPAAGRENDLKTALTGMLRDLPAAPGVTGAHLLLTETPGTTAPTTEQKIRGADRAADWIVLLSGYDPDAIENIVADGLSPSALGLAGARENSLIGNYRLAFTMTPLDLAAT